jgi:hypothetical protein
MSEPQFYPWIDALLLCIRDRGIPPPAAARWFFLACALAWDAVQYVSGSSTSCVDIAFMPSGKGTILESDIRTCFLITAIYNSWKILFASYMNAPVSYLDTVWTNQSPNIHSYNLITPALTSWMSRANAYLIARHNDGWKNAATPPGPIVNAGSSIISTGFSSAGVIQDLSGIPDISKWTPISTSGKVQSYLLPAWGTVVPLVSITAAVDAIGGQFFPDPTKLSKDTADVLQISEHLTDVEKMVAEFWTAGSATVTPPGMWMFIASKLCRSRGITVVEQIRLFKYLSAAVFQAGISAWYLKWKYQEARPVQTIRSTFRGQQGTIWTGTVDLGTWLPYQDLESITPPHPDFVSGHSTFSAAAARILDHFFGTASVPMVTFDAVDLVLCSPMFASSLGKSSLNSIVCPPGCSLHQVGVVPNAGITLSYSTWDSMADAAGRSRVYGGIHVESSNQGGLAVGRYVADKIFEEL